LETKRGKRPEMEKNERERERNQALRPREALSVVHNYCINKYK
jgi:hypothetical protein